MRKGSWITLLLLGAAAADGRAAVYQYSVMAGTRRAYLWIPPACRQVRGVVMSLSNLLERNWLEDPIVRQAAGAECLGTVWLGDGGRAPVLTGDMKPDAGEALQKMLKDLAVESGYREIEFAPLITMGHSANGQFSWTAVKWDPSRVIAAIPIKTYRLPASLKLGGVPLCYVVGETTEWPQYTDGRPGDRDFFWAAVRDSAVRLRSEDESNLVGVVTDPGGGHFDWSQRQARFFVALYIRKACRYRLPKKAGVNGPVKLKTIARESGWLTDTGGMEPDKFQPAPYRKYRGDPKKAYWFFDQETARAAVTFCGDRKKRERQMLTFVEDGKLLPVAKQGYAAMKFQPEADGLSFKVEGGFLPEMPQELIGAGKKLGHAPGPIQFRVITGPAVQTGPSSFRVQFDRAGMGGVLWLQEEHPGDDVYRHAVQVGHMLISQRLREGKVQKITFPKIEDQRAGVESIELKATSDSGLAVEYYVVAGPAEVDGRRLKLTRVPVRSRYPVKITVVAYQWGRSVEPLVRSAEPVEQTFLLTTAQR